MDVPLPLLLVGACCGLPLTIVLASSARNSGERRSPLPAERGLENQKGPNNL